MRGVPLSLQLGICKFAKDYLLPGEIRWNRELQTFVFACQ